MSTYKQNAEDNYRSGYRKEVTPTYSTATRKNATTLSDRTNNRRRHRCSLYRNGDTLGSVSGSIR